MMTHCLTVLMAFSAPPGGAGAPQDPKAQLFSTLGMFVVMGVLFYFALIRPQKLRQKELEDRVKGLKPGDKVLTSGGILGTIVTIKEKSLSIRSEDTKLEVLKSAVSEVTERKGELAETKS